MENIKHSIFIHRRMTIKIYLFYSFLAHFTMLISLLSLPLYRGSIHLKPFEGYFVHLTNEEGKTIEKTPSAYKVKKTEAGALDKAKDARAVLKPIEGDMKESTERLEDEKKVISEEKSELKMKAEEGKIAQAVEDKKPLEVEVVKKEEHEAKEPEKKEVIVQESPPVEKPKEVVKPSESPTLPEQNKVTSLEPKNEKEQVPSVEELKEETMYLESVEKVVVTEKKEEHEIVAKKEEVPEKVAEAKKPSEASDVGKVSKKEVPAGKGKEKKVAKAEGKPVRKAVTRGAKKTVSAPPPTLAKEDRRTSLEAQSGSEVVPSVVVAKGETIHVKDEGGPLADILTTGKNIMPPQEGSLLKKEEIKQQTMVEITPEAKEEKKPPLGIPVSDVFLAKDIKIEVFFHNAEISSFILHLLKKAHPMAHKKDDSGKPKEVDGIEEKSETYIADTPRVKRSLSVSKAEKAMYIFVIENKGGKACEADVVFRLFEGKAGERIKEVKPVELSTHAVVKFKFILPDAVFWDDEYYFTGTIESSDTLTKFNDKTGLIWKEEKDY